MSRAVILALILMAAIAVTRPAHGHDIYKDWKADTALHDPGYG